MSARPRPERKIEMRKQPKDCFCFDKDGYFAGADSDYGNAPPNNSTYVPPEVQDGFIPRWNGEAWEQVENHKGEKGYVAGQHTEIKEYGPLSEDWTTEPPPPPPDTRTPEEKRRAAYSAELDPIQAQIAGYKTEAEALRSGGDEAAAAECDAKAAALLKEFLATKQGIRERYPDDGE
jgi:hypothetical protein